MPAMLSLDSTKLKKKIGWSKTGPVVYELSLSHMANAMPTLYCYLQKQLQMVIRS
jgi:hypothetical protein